MFPARCDYKGEFLILEFPESQPPYYMPNRDSNRKRNTLFICDSKWDPVNRKAGLTATEIVMGKRRGRASTLGDALLKQKNKEPGWWLMPVI